MDTDSPQWSAQYRQLLSDYLRARSAEALSRLADLVGARMAAGVRPAEVAAVHGAAVRALRAAGGDDLDREAAWTALSAALRPYDGWPGGAAAADSGVRDSAETSGGQLAQAEARASELAQLNERLQRELAERKRTEAALRETERRLKLAGEGGTDGIWFWSPDAGDAEWWSPRMYELLGYQPGEIEPSVSVFLEHVHPDDRVRVERAADEHLTSGEPFEIEFRMRTRSGEYRWVQSRGKAEHDADGRPVCLGGLARDITVQKATEHALRASEERLQLALEATTDGLWEWDLETDALQFSARHATLLGYAPDGMPNTSNEWRPFVHPDDYTPAMQRIEAHIADRTAKFEIFGRLRTKSGEWRWFEGRGKVVRWSDDGRALRIVGTNTDVTERVHTEELLRIQRDLALALGGRVSLDDALRHVLDAGLRVEGIDSGGVYLLDVRDGSAVLHAHRGLSAEFVDAVRHYPADSAQVQLVMRGEPWFGAHPDLPLGAVIRRTEGLRGVAILPVAHEGRIVACMNLASHESDAFPPHARDALIAIAERLGPVIARVRVDAALRESEERHRLLAEHASDLISRVDREGTWFFVSGACRRLLGYEPEELVGESAYSFLHPDEIEMLRAFHDQVLATPEPQLITLRLRCKRGEYRWFETSARSIRDPLTGDVAEIIAVARDVTARRAAEEALRRSERLFRTLAAMTPVGIVIIQEDRIRYANPALGEILGVPSGALLQRPFAPYLHEDIRAKVVQRVRAQLAAPPRMEHYDITGVRTDGAERAIECFANVIEYERHPALLAAVVDLTERKRNEEALRRHQEQLAHVARVSTIGEMASGLAHELAQPLSAILYYARGAADRLADDADDVGSVRAALEQVGTQAERAGEFIRRIKMFVRRAQPQRRRVRVNAVVRDALDLAAPEARRGGAQVQATLDRGDPWVIVDPIQIQQVVLNLIRNAFEALADQDPAQRRVELRTRRDGERVEVSIRDSGPGLTPDQAGRVFDPFFTTKSDGTGLGLSISRSIIEAHGGTIWAHPASPGGGTFGFTLQADEERDDDPA
jgi:two-component system sensor kinase FixL